MTRPRPAGLQPQDRGLQPERTTLAWRRTLLALVIADFFIWRAWLTTMYLNADHSPQAALGLGVAAVTATAATAVTAGCVIRRVRGLRATNSAPSSRLLVMATSGLVALAASIGLCLLLSK